MAWPVRRRLLKRYPIFLLIGTALLFRAFSSSDKHVGTSPWSPSTSLRLAEPWTPSPLAIPVHIAVIFDEHRMSYGLQAVRSAAHFTPSLRAHIVAPTHLHPTIRRELAATSAKVSFYDHGSCSELTKAVRAFSDPTIHISAHCKVYLASILEDVTLVLYLDNDATVVDNLRHCYGPLPPGALFGMAVDAGEVCQIHPDKCWPMSLEFVPEHSLRCGNLASRYDPAKYMADDDAFCPRGSEAEPAQVNGGVILMDLDAMRASNFTSMYAKAVASTFQLARTAATWGEQEFLNSFIRLHPYTFSLLPCGCNYQYTGARREVKCPSQPIHVVHAWSSGVKKRSLDPYNQLFYHFLHPDSAGSPPPVPLFSDSAADISNIAAPLALNVNCLRQSYECSSGSQSRWGDTVYVLTRTSGRPNYFAEARASILGQSYPFVEHIVVTDDAESLSYLHGMSPHLVPSQAGKFDSEEICRKCGHLSLPGNCAAAPYVGSPNREAFLACYCSTQYPMNLYMNTLFNLVKEKDQPGWIIILDDDNILAHPNIISRLVLDIEHQDQLLLFPSLLGRTTPTAANMFQKFVVQGDIDASNHMFHSSHVTVAQWTNQRCADWRSIDALSKHLLIKWSNSTAIMAHPLRAKLGGLGKRGDTGPLIGLVITVHNTAGSALWNMAKLAAYCSYRYLTMPVIVHWEHSSPIPVHQPPCAKLVLSKAELEVAVKMAGAEYILATDSDIFLTQDAMLCMLNHVLHSPDRVAGISAVSTTDPGTWLIRSALLRVQHYNMLKQSRRGEPYTSFFIPEGSGLQPVVVRLSPGSLVAIACSATSFTPFTTTTMGASREGHIATTEVGQCGERGHITFGPALSTSLSLDQLSATSPQICPKNWHDLVGVAREVKEFCPEKEYDQWLEALLDHSICPSAAASEHTALWHSAKLQCGAWCIWDLRTAEPTGWFKTADCFAPFAEGHHCQKWLYQRPTSRLSI